MSLVMFSNFGDTQLAGSITNIATTANLLSGAGAEFPAPTNGQYFVAEFNDTATGLLYEVVHVTNVTGDTITMVRGQEGTSAIAWSAGDLFFSGTTAGMLDVFQQAFAYNGDPNGHVAGAAGSAGNPPTICWDTATGSQWYCTSSGDAASATWAQLFTQPFLTDTGTGNTVVVAFTTPPSSLSQLIDVPFYVKKSNSASTGAVVLNANALGNTSTTMVDGTAFNSVFNWPANAIAIVSYDGTAFRVLNFLTPAVVTQTLGVQYFISNGIFTVPAGVTSVEYEVWGGGGGAGGTLGAGSGSSSGAGGGYASGVATGLTPGQTIAVTVGAAGTGGNGSPTNGTAGGTSSFGSFASATGGGGGFAANGTITGSAPSGGTGSGGALVYSGYGGGVTTPLPSPTLGQALGGGTYKSPPPPIAVSATSLQGTSALYPGTGGNGSVHGASGGNGAPGLVIVRWS